MNGINYIKENKMNPQDIDNLIKLLNEVREQQTQLTQHVKDIIKEVIREEMPTHFPNTPWSATNKGE